MSLAKVVIFDGALQRQAGAGDIVAGGEIVPATNATTAITVTGASLLNGIILRSGAAAMTDTLDSAANIIAALVGAVNGNAIQPGTTFRCRWVVSTANAITVAATANTGVTVNRGAVAASSSRDFLITVANGTPAQTLGALTTSGSAIVTGFTAQQLALLSVGMIVTNAVANLQGQTIISINFAAGSVTLSGNANATNTVPVAIAFSPVIVVDGI